MSAPNFKTMSDFPLIVAADVYIKICPECGLGNCNDADKCEDCGCDLTEVESIYEDFAMSERIREMEKAAEKMNAAQDFYEVTVESGYYTGVQFYVKEKYYDVEKWDNEDAQYEFGCCRSEMLRRYKVAGNTVRRELKKAAYDLFLTELNCVGIFSNGEAIYEVARAA